MKADALSTVAASALGNILAKTVWSASTWGFLVG